jgi:hypothetical protein
MSCTTRTNRFTRQAALQPSARLALWLLAVLFLAACNPNPYQGPEEGWIPDPRGPRWVTYQVEGNEAVYQGDIVFPLPELRAWQATVTDPIPLRVESYDMIDGTHWAMYDKEYGDGTQGAPNAVLSGSTGRLTDGQAPAPHETGFVLEQPGTVAWASDPTITFHFDGVKTIDTVRLDLRTVPNQPYADRVEIRVGDRVVVQPLDLEIGTTGESVALSGAQLPDDSYEGLGLEGDSVELTFYRTGSMQVMLAEVAFESGTRPAADWTEATPDAAIEEGASWGATVPYSIASGFTWTQIDEIEEAIAEWEAKSDYTFVEDPGADRRIRFKPHGSRCFSTGVGKVGRFESIFGSNVREVRLADVCFFAEDPSGNVVQHHGIILHEIGHALGFYHEQARSDRSKYVDYFEYNVKSSKRDQYDKQGDLFGDYNYNSIMHYGDTDFGRKMCCTQPGVSGAIDSGEGLPDGCFYQHVGGIDSDGDDKPDTCTGHPDAPYEVELKTMVSKRTLPEDFQLGQRWTLSKGDVSAANALLDGHFAHRSYRALSIEAIDRWEDDDASYTLLGDVNNDGRDDLVAVYDENATAGLPGSVHVALGQPDGTFLPDGMWSSSFCYGEVCRLGDLDGDGKKDLVSFDRDSGYVRVAWSYGGEFTPVRSGYSSIVSTSLAYGRDEFLLGDLDGNCTDDILAIIEEHDPQTFSVDFWIRPARVQDGQATYLSQFKVEGKHQVRLADVDGDGAADLLYWNEFDHTVSVRLAASHYTAEFAFFEPSELYALNGCFGECEFADMNGDGRADLVDMDSQWGHHLSRVKIRPSTGYGLVKVAQYHELDCRSAWGCELADVNGDGQPDLVDTTSSTSGKVWVSLSTEFLSDDIGEVKPRAGGSIGSMSTCLDLPGMDSF